MKIYVRVVCWSVVTLGLIAVNVVAAPTGAPATSITLDGSLGHAGSVLGHGSVFTITPGMGRRAGSNLLESFGVFDLGTGDTAKFQSGGASNIVARVTGGSASTIDGTILSNANLFFLNPSGVIFNQHAQVDVKGAFSVSTANYVKLSDGSVFYADTQHLASDPGVTSAPISSYGFLKGAAPAGITITGASLSTTGGPLEIVGGDLTIGSGASLSANGGAVGLFSGGQVGTGSDATVSSLSASKGASYATATGFSQKGAIQIAGAGAGATIQAKGKGGRIIIGGGEVDMNSGTDVTAAGSGAITVEATDLTISTGATVAATQGGSIRLLATDSISDAGRLNASALDTPGGSGGSIVLTAPTLDLGSSAVVDVRGNAGGGSAFLGGGAHGADASVADAETISIAAGAQITADAVNSGNAGRVVVWSNNDTEYYGNISAQGGTNSGNGGSVEVSGGYLNFQGQVSMLAAHGKVGSLLLDPYDLTIADMPSSSDISISDTPPTTVTPGAEGDVLAWTKVQSLLNGGDLTITTVGTGGTNAGNIDLEGAPSLSITSIGGVAPSLTLNATGAITLGNSLPQAQANVTISGLSSLNLNAGSTGVAFYKGSNLNVGNASVVINTTGAVTEAGTPGTPGSITAGAVTVKNASGVTLDGANQVGSINLTDDSATGITFKNTAATLAISGISETGADGDVTITNAGAITVSTGKTVTGAGSDSTVSLTTTGAGITLDGAISNAGGAVDLKATGAISDANGSATTPSVTAASLTTDSGAGTTLGSKKNLAIATFNGTDASTTGITVKNGQTLAISGIDQTGGGDVTITNAGAITVANTGGNTISLGGGQLTLDNSDSTHASNLEVLGAIADISQNNPAGTVLLKSNGEISDGGEGSIAAQNLATSSAQRTSLTNEANNDITGDFAAIDTADSAISFSNGNNIKIGAVSGVTGVTGGAVALTTAGKIENDGGVITASALTTTSGNGTNLTANNVVASFSATDNGGSNIALTDTPSANLTIQQINTTDGFTGANGNVTLKVNGSSGKTPQVVQGSGAITSNQLAVSGGASYFLSDSNNELSFFTGNTTGEIQLTADQNSTLTITGVTSLASPGDSAFVLNANDLLIQKSSSIKATNGDLVINVNTLEMGKGASLSSSQGGIFLDAVTSITLDGDTFYPEATSSIAPSTDHYYSGNGSIFLYDLSKADPNNDFFKTGSNGSGMTGSGNEGPALPLVVYSGAPGLPPPLNPTPLGQIVLDGSLMEGSNSPIVVTGMLDPDGTSLTYQVLPSDGEQVGSNLFFSFSELNLAPNETLDFNMSGDASPVQNIYARVTNFAYFQPSIISGNIQAEFKTNGSTVPTLCLINPAGIEFRGNNQSGIMVTDQSGSHISTNLVLTTATSLAFGGSQFYSVLGSGQVSSDASIKMQGSDFSGPVAGYNFEPSLLSGIAMMNSLSSSQLSSLKITPTDDENAYFGLTFDQGNAWTPNINGVTVPSLNQVELIGGNIDLAESSYLSANNLVLFGTQTPNASGGMVEMTQPSSYSVSVASAISNGQIIVAGGNGSTSGNVTIENDSVLYSNQGIIQINANDLALAGGLIVDQIPLDAQGSSGSAGGNGVWIQAPTVGITTTTGDDSFIITANLGNSGFGLDINISATDLTIDGGLHLTGGGESVSNQTVGLLASAQPSFAFNFTGQRGQLESEYTEQVYQGTESGNSGNINLNIGGNLTVQSGAEINAATTGGGAGGSVTIGPVQSSSLAAILGEGSPSVTINGGSINTSATVGQNLGTLFTTIGSAGPVTLDTSQFALGDFTYADSTAMNPDVVPGRISSSTGVGSLAGGSVVLGDAGKIQIISNGNVTITGGEISSATLGEGGSGGDVEIDTPSAITISGGGEINVSTSNSSNSGRVNIGSLTPPSSVNITGGGTVANDPSGIVATVDGSGEGGQYDASLMAYPAVEIYTGALTLDDGAQINSAQINPSTDVAGFAGDIVIRAGPQNLGGTTVLQGSSGMVQISNGAAILDGTASQSISQRDELLGGDVFIDTVGKVTLESGGYIDVSTTGVGDSGSVLIGAHTPPASVTITGPGSRISAEALAGSSGSAGQTNFVTFTNPAVYIVSGALTLQDDGEINSSTAGTGLAGDIQIGTSSASVPYVDVMSGGSINADTGAGGMGGNINLYSGALTVTGAGSSVSAGTTGQGAGGNIEVDVTGGTSATQSVQVLTGGSVNASTSGSGNGGNVTFNLNGTSMLVSGAGSSITAGSSEPPATEPPATVPPAVGTAGSINIENCSGLLVDQSGAISTDAGATENSVSLNTVNAMGQTVPNPDAFSGGQISIQAQEATVDSGGEISANTSGVYQGGSIIIQAGLLQVQDFNANGFESQISAGTSGTGNGGSILIDVTGNNQISGETGDIALTNGGQISADSTGDGSAGAIVIFQQNSQDLRTNPNAGLLIDGSITPALSGVTPTNAASISSSENGTRFGPAGVSASADIDIITQQLTLTQGASIDASTSDSYNGGGINILDPGTLTLKFGSVIDASSNFVNLLNADPSSLSTAQQQEYAVQVQEANAGELNTRDIGGNAGDINIGQIINPPTPAATTSDPHPAQPPQYLDTLESLLSQTTPVTVMPSYVNVLGTTASPTELYDTTNDLVFSDSSGVKSNNASGKEGGKITISASQVNIQHNSFVSAESQSSDQIDGVSNIIINAATNFYLNDYSDIITDAKGKGGNITIDPQFEVLNHSYIDAQGGSGNGNVLIQSDFLEAGDSQITASGVVSIDSVLLNLSGSLVALPQDPVDDSKKLRETCARVVAHDLSSISLVGRGGTETAPDEFSAANTVDSLPQGEKPDAGKPPKPAKANEPTKSRE